MKRLIVCLILIISLTVFFPVWAQTQPVPSISDEPSSDEPSEPAAESAAAITEQDFVAARETFLASQTTANKQAYDAAAVNWARQIVEEQLAYIDEQEQFWYEQLRDKEGVAADWLAAEREMIIGWQTDLEKVNNYAQARNVIGQTKANWQQVRQKINQLRVWRAYDNLALLVLQTKAIRAELLKVQTAFQSEQPELGPDYWQDWNLVLATYEAGIDKVDDKLQASRGSLATIETSEDFITEIWPAEIIEMTEIIEELKILALLQTQAINEFYRLQARFSN